ncbi:hypothetical protein VR45_38800 [Streptomyces sp. NRRL S-495]|nr:hypothetical protein VR45_38800 [Streptomyces sp. NRRL S-495]
MTAQRPNVLVVLTGQQTADAMGAAGNPYLATPHMDSLATTGTRYRRAYCGQPLCAPSRTGLLTGRLPSATGGTGATADGAVAEPSLGRVFAEAGYDCVYTGSWQLPEHEAPDGHGFRRLHPPTGTDGRDRTDGSVGTVGTDAGFARTVTGFLTRPRSRPFLLLLPLPEPHGISAWARGQDPSTGPLPPPPPDLAGPTGPEGPTDRVGPTGPAPSLSPSTGPRLRPGLPGRSVLAPEPRETVVVETHWELPGFEDALGRMVRDERHKYVCYAWGDNREQLFDLVEDPGEMVNLAADARNAALLDRFRALLAEHCVGTGDPFGRFIPAHDDAHAPNGG